MTKILVFTDENGHKLINEPRDGRLPRSATAGVISEVSMSCCETASQITSMLNMQLSGTLAMPTSLLLTTNTWANNGQIFNINNSR